LKKKFDQLVEEKFAGVRKREVVLDKEVKENWLMIVTSV